MQDCRLQIVACKAYRPSLSGRSVRRRNATMTASSPTDETVDFGSVGPVLRSDVDVRFFHFATVFGLIPYRLDSALRLS